MPSTNCTRASTALPSTPHGRRAQRRHSRHPWRQRGGHSNRRKILAPAPRLLRLFQWGRPATGAAPPVPEAAGADSERVHATLREEGSEPMRTQHRRNRPVRGTILRAALWVIGAFLVAASREGLVHSDCGGLSGFQCVLY